MSVLKILNMARIKYSGMFVSGIFGKIYNNISFQGYMKSKEKHMKKLGIDIKGALRYVASDAYFDGHDYSRIHLGEDIVISREVMFLVHDYSLGRAMSACGIKIQEGAKETPHIVDDIEIGDKCFIGARASILPGTKIGYGSIIGACTVVKGNIPEYSIVVGNPCRIIGDVRKWVNKNIENKGRDKR